jgi:hypothetical protein
VRINEVSTDATKTNSSRTLLLWIATIVVGHFMAVVWHLLLVVKVQPGFPSSRTHPHRRRSHLWAAKTPARDGPIVAGEQELREPETRSSRHYSGAANRCPPDNPLSSLTPATRLKRIAELWPYILLPISILGLAVRVHRGTI